MTPRPQSPKDTIVLRWRIHGRQLGEHIAVGREVYLSAQFPWALVEEVDREKNELVVSVRLVESFGSNVTVIDRMFTPTEVHP